MKTAFLATAFAIGIGLSGPVAYAQVSTGPAITAEELELPAEREVVVREYVIREPVAPVIIEGGGTVRPGSIVPDYVRLRSFESIDVPSLRRYGYFVSPDNKIVIVEPATRQVMRIIAQQ